MSKLIAYYSRGGKTAKLCKELAGRTGAQLVEIRDAKRRGLIATFLIGCRDALGSKASDILPLEQDPAAFDEIYLAFPVWAGHLPPAVNAFLRTSALKGKNISCISTGAGTNVNIEAQVRSEIEKAGGNFRALTEITDKDRKAGNDTAKAVALFK